MNPREQAEHLIRQFKNLEIDDNTEVGMYMSWEDSKKCAMIVVESHIQTNPLSKYWEYVKQEIKNL